MKIIKIKSCSGCPYHGKCKAWKKLASQARLLLAISNRVPNDFILKDCPLEDDLAAKIISDTATLFKILDDSNTYRPEEWPTKTLDLLVDIERRINLMQEGLEPHDG